MKTYLLLTLLIFSSLISVQSQNSFSEEKFIRINGIDQWITIKGEKSKPMILFLHGGPGSPMSPYSDEVYSTWEKDFIIVQWDQRGTAKPSVFMHRKNWILLI